MKSMHNNNYDLTKTVISPYFSEKGTLIAEKNKQYIFKVHLSAKKADVKKIVEMYFNVPVESVRVCRVEGKNVNFKQLTGKRNNWKKAYVSLKSGHSIDFTKDIKIK